MPFVGPPESFATSRLEVADIPAGESFGRIYLSRYPNPVGIGKTESRFSDPRRRMAENRFGVLYLGQTLKVCFLEAVLRDRHDGEAGNLPIAEAELSGRTYAVIETIESLTLVDLRDDSAIRMGVPTDVARASRQSLARKWSVAFHEHAAQVDGIIYPSRLNAETNLAIYDKSISKLSAQGTTSLIGAPGLASVLNELRVALV